MNICFHCLRTLGINECYFVVKKIPKGLDWIEASRPYKKGERIGVCCEDCYEAGKGLRVEHESLSRPSTLT